MAINPFQGWYLSGIFIPREALPLEGSASGSRTFGGNHENPSRWLWESFYILTYDNPIHTPLLWPPLLTNSIHPVFFFFRGLVDPGPLPTARETR